MLVVILWIDGIELRVVKMIKDKIEEASRLFELALEQQFPKGCPERGRALYLYAHGRLYAHLLIQEFKRDLEQLKQDIRDVRDGHKDS